MTPPVDPNDVLMTGENSFIRLSSDGGKTLTDRFSHWRVLWCPEGAGHTLFVHSTLIDGGVRIYSDNQAVARSRTSSGSSSETTLAAPFAESATRSRSTARLGFRFNSGRFMADALYITRREEEL